MEKIKMTTPLVEMDGDEMTRIIWQMVKDELLKPYIDLNTEYYDLSLKNRDDSNDQITIEAAIFSEGAEKRFSKKSGMVALPRCCVMTRVRRPRMTQARKEPMIALPMPTQVAAMPNFQPNWPA